MHELIFHNMFYNMQLENRCHANFDAVQMTSKPTHKDYKQQNFNFIVSLN